MLISSLISRPTKDTPSLLEISFGTEGGLLEICCLALCFHQLTSLQPGCVLCAQLVCGAGTIIADSMKLVMVWQQRYDS